MGTKQKKSSVSPVKGALISQLHMGWESCGSGKALGIDPVVLALAAFQEGMTPEFIPCCWPAQGQGRISPNKTSSDCFQSSQPRGLLLESPVGGLSIARFFSGVCSVVALSSLPLV